MYEQRIGGRIRAAAAVAGIMVAAGAHAQSCRTVVRFSTLLGSFDVTLLDQDAPVTVANFIHYVRTGRYEGTFVHRSVPGFVIQGGAFSFSDATGLHPVPEFATIPNEFSIAHRNVARTMAMAKPANSPDGATSQYFINLVDNSWNLDYQDGGFAVFGEVTSGWNVVTAIAALNVANYSAVHPYLLEVPVLTAGQAIMESILLSVRVDVVQPCPCYANCDGSSAPPVLNIFDFLCFLDRFAAGGAYANCDGSTSVPVLNVNDFVCFLDRFSAGCS